MEPARLSLKLNVLTAVGVKKQIDVLLQMTPATLDRLNKYFAFSEMPVISSEYWNMMFQHGSSVEMDDMGHKILQTLGVNMANMLKKLNA